MDLGVRLELQILSLARGFSVGICCAKLLFLQTQTLLPEPADIWHRAGQEVSLLAMRSSYAAMRARYMFAVAVVRGFYPGTSSD